MHKKSLESFVINQTFFSRTENQMYKGMTKEIEILCQVIPLVLRQMISHCI